MNNDRKSSYTCITCSVAFVDSEVQRDHYKTEWHRYNLKRKVAEMNPVTESDFKKRVEASLRKSEDNNKGKDGSSGDAYCAACSKHFANSKAHKNHLGSRKHLEMANEFDKKENKEEIEANRKSRKLALEEQKKAEEEAQKELLQRAEAEGMEIEEVDSDEWEDDNNEDGDFNEDPIPANDCLFCPHHSSNLDKNVIHMSTAHSFFIPDVEYLTDLGGLLQYLGAKVGQGNVCLWCNDKGRAFRSTEAVRKHMVDKGHCKIQLLTGGDCLAEFADFYDYSSSYPDADAAMADEDAIKNDPDAEVDVDVLDDTGFELVLPSGARIGHRSLFRYFRQNLTADKTVALARSYSTRNIQTHYKSLGWTGLSTMEARRKAKDIKFMHRIQQKQWMKLGTKANKLQKHWRDPTMLY